MPAVPTAPLPPTPPARPSCAPPLPTRPIRPVNLARSTPSLVNVTLSMFACRRLDPGSGGGGAYASHQAATWRYGYW